FILQIDNIGGRVDDLVVSPLVGRFAAKGDFDQRLEQADVAPPEHRHEQRADDRRGERQPVPQGERNDAEEVFHESSALTTPTPANRFDNLTGGGGDVSSHPWAGTSL